MFYLKKSKYAISLNIKVTKIERSAFLGHPVYFLLKRKRNRYCDHIIPFTGEHHASEARWNHFPDGTDVHVYSRALRQPALQSDRRHHGAWEAQRHYHDGAWCDAPNRGRCHGWRYDGISTIGSRSLPKFSDKPRKKGLSTRVAGAVWAHKHFRNVLSASIMVSDTTRTVEGSVTGNQLMAYQTKAGRRQQINGGSRFLQTKPDAFLNVLNLSMIALSCTLRAVGDSFLGKKIHGAFRRPTQNFKTLAKLEWCFLWACYPIIRGTLSEILRQTFTTSSAWCMDAISVGKWWRKTTMPSYILQICHGSY